MHKQSGIYCIMVIYLHVPFIGPRNVRKLDRTAWHMSNKGGGGIQISKEILL